MAEFRLDEKTKKSLLGLMPFTQSGTMNFTPSMFDTIPIEAQPIFKQRAFTRGEVQQYRDIIKDDGAKTDDKLTLLMALTRPTVLGWERQFDLATGDLLPFKADEDKGASKDLWTLIPDVIKLSLYRNCSIASGLQVQEKQGLK